jgi:tetratricopeptide (TPR) repeat protein
MDKKKAKKSTKKIRNVNDANDVILDPGKILKSCERDFNNAKTMEDYSSVAKKLEDFIAKQSENAKAIALFGHCYVKMGEPQRALMEFSQACEKDPNNADYYNQAGFCHQSLKQYDHALTQYTHAISLDKDKGEYFYNRGTVKKDMNNFQDAIDDFEKAITSWEKKSSHNPEQSIYNAYYLKGICLRQLEKFEDSINDLKKAVDLKPEDPSAHNNLGLSYFKAGSFDDAANEYTKAIQNTQVDKQKFEVDPETRKSVAIYSNNRGLAYYHLTMYEEAKKDFDEAIHLNESEAIYYFNRVNVAYDQGQYDEAHKDYNRAIDLQPGDSRFYHSKGLAFEGTKNDEDFEAAIDNYKKAIELDETFFGARFHLGNMYHKNLQFQEARQCFSTVLSNYSTDKKIYVNRGLVYQDMGNHQFAIMDFDSAIKIDEAYSEAYYHRGVSKLKSKGYMEAIDDLNKALEFQEQPNFGIYDALGCCHQVLRDYDQALRYMDEAIENDPENIQFLMNRAQCYFELQHYTESIGDLERALDLDENDPKVLYKLGLSYYAFGKYKRSIKKLKKALKSKSMMRTLGGIEMSSARSSQHLTYESDIYYHIGIAYSNLERFEESIFPLTKAIE